MAVIDGRCLKVVVMASTVIVSHFAHELFKSKRQNLPKGTEIPIPNVWICSPLNRLVVWSMD